MDTERKNSLLKPEQYDLEILLRRPSLRTNLPRKISQARRDSEEEKLEAILKKETTCGLGCIRSKWLQSFANRKTYIFVFGVLGSFYGAYCAHFYGIITTLEKRFQWSSKTIGLLAMTSNIVELLMSFMLFLYIPKTYRPSWIGFGIYTIMASSILLTLPHFLYEPKETWEQFYKNLTYQRMTEVKGSENSQLCTYNEKEGNMPMILIFLSQILLGMGGSLFFILGRSYREDNIKIYHTPALLSLLSILKTLGPAIGYWLSSMCLKIFMTPNKKIDAESNNPHWVGAWWLGNLIMGFMLFVLGGFMILFPSVMPKAAASRELQSESMKKNNENEGKKTSWKVFFKLSSDFIEFSGILNIFGLIAYSIFLPKYAEIQYRLTPSESNLITGTITLICAAFGIIIATSVINKYRPNPTALAAWDLFVGILSICALTSYIYFGCQENDEQIKALTMQLQNYKSTCKCDDFQFSPICNEFYETFISNCHTGCKEKVVSCSSKFNDKTSQGICPVECHFKLIIFSIITCSLTFIYSTSQISKFWFELKNSTKEYKSKKSSFSLVFIRFIIFILSPILFGHIFDQNCLLWEYDCSQTGNCWLYDNEKLRYTVNLVAMGFVTIGIICDLGNWYFIKNFKLFDDDDHNEGHFINS